MRGVLDVLGAVMSGVGHILRRFGEASVTDCYDLDEGVGQVSDNWSTLGRSMVNDAMITYLWYRVRCWRSLYLILPRTMLTIARLDLGVGRCLIGLIGLLLVVFGFWHKALFDNGGKV